MGASAHSQQLLDGKPDDFLLLKWSVRSLGDGTCDAYAYPFLPSAAFFFFVFAGADRAASPAGGSWSGDCILVTSKGGNGKPGHTGIVELERS